MSATGIYYSYNSPGKHRTPVSVDVRLDNAQYGFRLTQRQDGTPMVEIDGDKTAALNAVDALIAQLTALKASL